MKNFKLIPICFLLFVSLNRNVCIIYVEKVKFFILYHYQLDVRIAIKFRSRKSEITWFVDNFLYWICITSRHWKKFSLKTFLVHAARRKVTTLTTIWNLLKDQPGSPDLLFKATQKRQIKKSPFCTHSGTSILHRKSQI